MMVYRVIYTQKALADLDAVADYIKLKLCNFSAAECIVENFFYEGDSLTNFPTRYPLCKDSLLHTWGIRFVPVKNYLLFYIVREDEQKVYVIRFLYSKRNWQKILRNDIGNGGAEYAPIFKVPYVQEDVEKYGK